MAEKCKGTKREWDMSEIEKGSSVCTHGIPVAVSPAKKSRKNDQVTYFDGKSSDGKIVIRVLSFETGFMKELKEAHDKRLCRCIE